MKLAAAMITVLGAATVLPAAHAQDAGDWIWRIGIHNVRPKSDNNDTVNVDAAATLTFNGTYMLAPRWGVELLAALPFDHDINLNGGGKVIQGLMCDGKLATRDIESRYALDFNSYFATELRALDALAADGLVTHHDAVIRVTDSGRALLRTVAMVFDAYLQRNRSPQFSKVI